MTNREKLTRTLVCEGRLSRFNFTVSAAKRPRKLRAPTGVMSVLAVDHSDAAPSSKSSKKTSVSDTATPGTRSEIPKRNVLMRFIVHLLPTAAGFGGIV
jgi:hypothetical protein